MASHPEQAKSMGLVMALQRGNTWLDNFPVEKDLGEFPTKPEDVLFVDVGGAFGQQAAAFRHAFPNLPGRIIVQDLPVTLMSAKPIESLEFVAHDFHKPQPIKGAKIYYLRKILHDWPDNDCINILKNIVDVMDPNSRLIVDEVVMPDIGVPWQAAYMDLTMMASLGGLERTKVEYEDLLDRAGLKVVQIHEYDPERLSIIVALPKSL
jgi:demethylsterigmatocystin 6-O-methyltransferase